MVAQMLLQCPSDRLFLRRARRRLGHLFPYLPSQPRYNERCRALAPKLVVLWNARVRDAGRRDELRLLDTTPLPCGQSIDDPTQPARALGRLRLLPRPLAALLGLQLVLLCAPDGTIIDFDLVAANHAERDAALTLLEANAIEGATIICDKGFAGADFEAAVRALRPAAQTEQTRRTRSPHPADRPDPTTDRIDRQQPKDQLLLERHGGRTPAGLLTRITARILALCACINLNQLGRPTRALAAYAE